MKDELDPGTAEMPLPNDPHKLTAVAMETLGVEHPYYFEKSVQSRYLDEQGREIPNPTPMQPPVGYKRRPTIAEQMRQMIRQASYEAGQAGAETEEEANDFDVGEDMEPTSPWENDFEPDPALDHMLARMSQSPTPGGESPAPAAAQPKAGDAVKPSSPPASQE